MPVPVVEPKVSILALVKDSWNSENVGGGVTPDFHTGWFNPKSIKPQMTFNSADETYEGATGYGAIEGSGGPVQIVDGVLFVNCWAFRDEGAGGVNPKQLVYDMAKELRRIVLANFQTIVDLTFISVLNVDDVPPVAGVNPQVYQKAVTLGYNWRTT